MASIESQEIRKSIINDIVNLHTPIDIERKEWEEYASTVKLPEEIKIEKKTIENIYTEWISGK